MKRVESKSPCTSLSGHESINVGCMVFRRLESVENPTGLPSWLFGDSQLLEARRRMAAGRATEEVWMKWSPDSKGVDE